jgi:hypothetical protein
LFIPDPDFLPVADPEVKKSPDPGSGSATLVVRNDDSHAACLGNAESHDDSEAELTEEHEKEDHEVEGGVVLKCLKNRYETVKQILLY